MTSLFCTKLHACSWFGLEPKEKLQVQLGSVQLKFRVESFCNMIIIYLFAQDKLMEYVLSTVRPEFKPLQENKSIFVFCHSSSGHKHAVSEVLSDPNITSRLSDTKAAGEVKALTDFYTMLKNEPARAFYGPAQCIAASEQEAIDTLLVTGEVVGYLNVEP